MHVKAIELEAIMKREHVSMKLVLNNEERVIGVVSLHDITDDKIMKKVDKFTARDELLVTEFMQPRSTLMAFDMKELASATIEDVLETQKNNHQQHCLVIDREAHQIRGLISARDVARLINRSIDIETHISFESLFQQLKSK